MCCFGRLFSCCLLGVYLGWYLLYSLGLLICFVFDCCLSDYCWLCLRCVVVCFYDGSRVCLVFVDLLVGVLYDVVLSV